MDLLVNSPNDLNAAASKIISFASNNRVFLFYGNMGAGKTTLISILAGLARADSGSIAVRGHDVVTDFREARRSLGVVPQEASASWKLSRVQQ